MLVDTFARQKNRRPQFILKTFFGQLQHLFRIQLPECHELGTDATTVLIAAIKTCVIESSFPMQLDIHQYTRLGQLHFVDLKNVQCLVGRIFDRNQWSIVDRSGALARAVYLDSA